MLARVEIEEHLMKHFVGTVAVIFLALPMSAGYSYRFQSVSSGGSSKGITGSVRTEGSSLRVDVEKGDGLLMKDHAVVISADGGKTILVAEPSAATYYVLSLQDALAGATGILKQLGGIVSVSVGSSRVVTSNGGSGGVIEGRPTSRVTVDVACDLRISIMGEKMTQRLTIRTESWLTDRIPGSAMTFLQLQGLRTGIEGLDRLIESQSAAIGTRFPLKQVTTTSLHQGNSVKTTVTTSTVSAIRQVSVAPDAFNVPSTWRKVPSPLDAMMKTMNGALRAH